MVPWFRLATSAKVASLKDLYPLEEEIKAPVVPIHVPVPEPNTIDTIMFTFLDKPINETKLVFSFLAKK